MRIYLTIFVSVLLAELGDETRLATLLFATDPSASKTAVFVAAAGALCLSTLAAVLVGGQLGRLVDPRVLRMIAGGDSW